MFHKKIQLVILVVLVFFCKAFVSAEIKLPAIIGDNMVLQQKMDVPIWGWAEAGEKISVEGSWMSLPVSTKTGQNSMWKVKVRTPKAGGPYKLVIEGNEKIELSGVMIGEVWLCSGQSNMEMLVKWAANADEEIAAANYSDIRLFMEQKAVAEQPQYNCDGSWVMCSRETAKDFSAVGYFFGRELYKELSVPIGLIHSAWGGTPAEAWIKKEILTTDMDFTPILDRWEQYDKERPRVKQEYEESLKKWKKLSAEAKEQGNSIPAKPNLPIQLYNWNKPASLYNGMIAPLIPYAIRGVIWYQGESNASRAYQYRKLFPAMISNWRNDWKQGDFSFYFVQLACFVCHTPDKEVIPQKGLPGEDSWAELREAQLMTLGLPNTGMAVAIDIGTANDIHPKNKQDVGKRLALWALAKDYGKDIVYSGPIYRKMEVEGNKIRLYFDHIDGGLIAKNGAIDGFAIAGADKKFIWADAEIQGDTVIVSSCDAPDPVAVRYGWAVFPLCNLFNKKGLPASPFRTDDWLGVTINNK